MDVPSLPGTGSRWEWTVKKIYIGKLAGFVFAVGPAVAAVPAAAANVSVNGLVETLTFGGQVNGTNINTFFDGGTDMFGTAGGANNNVGITFSTPGEFLNAGYNGSGF